MPPRIEYPTGTKVCRRCGTGKPLNEFYTVKSRGGAPTSRCKACVSAEKPAYRRTLTPATVRCVHCGTDFIPKKRPDIAKYCSRNCRGTAWSRTKGVQPMRGAIVDGRKQCTRCKEWKTLDHFGRRADRRSVPLSQCKPCMAEQARAYHAGQRGRDRRYAKKYGVTIEWYDEMMAHQAGVCAICGSPPSSNSRTHPHLAIDHDHQTGATRGLLCFNCNGGLGQFKDDPELLEKALRYLTYYRSAQA